MKARLLTRLGWFANALYWMIQSALWALGYLALASEHWLLAILPWVPFVIHEAVTSSRSSRQAHH